MDFSIGDEENGVEEDDRIGVLKMKMTNGLVGKDAGKGQRTLGDEESAEVQDIAETDIITKLPTELSRNYRACPFLSGLNFLPHWTISYGKAHDTAFAWIN